MPRIFSPPFGCRRGPDGLGSGSFSPVDSEKQNDNRLPRKRYGRQGNGDKHIDDKIIATRCGRRDNGNKIVMAGCLATIVDNSDNGYRIEGAG